MVRPRWARYGADQQVHGVPAPHINDPVVEALCGYTARRDTISAPTDHPADGPRCPTCMCLVMDHLTNHPDQAASWLT
jgi:hypothetical protein